MDAVADPKAALFKVGENIGEKIGDKVGDHIPDALVVNFPSERVERI